MTIFVQFCSSFGNVWQHLVTCGDSCTFWQIIGDLKRLESDWKAVLKELGINWKCIGMQLERDWKRFERNYKGNSKAMGKQRESD